jgi:2-polyprenyl-6-methoxyphenol hydroxylase-like FAD-dependent oxidoreductase
LIRTGGASRNHAVVIGGGLAGLLTARVLSGHFGKVTLVDRDALPQSEPRKGVPQGQHVHALLSKGQEILSQLFPDLMPALIAGGAVPADMGLHFHWHHHGAWKTRFKSDIAITLFTRPFLECLVAERVRARDNVRLVEGSVEQLLTDPDRARVTGVAVRSREAGTTSVHADLVVDASGRGSQCPQWLEAIGCPAPAESTVRVDVTYASRLYQAPPDARAWQAINLVPLPPNKRQGVVFAVEGGRLLATLVGFHGERPPTDEAGYLDYARSLVVPAVYQAIVDARPLSAIAIQRFPANLRRHYERLDPAPDRLLVVGDAACSFNPVYGQGITVSALEAMLLDRLLSEQAGNGIAGLSARFHKAAAAIVDTPWQLTTGEDLRHPDAVGPRSPVTAFLHWYTDRLHRRCDSDAALALGFYRVMHMLDAPSALFRPQMLWRVLRG